MNKQVAWYFSKHILGACNFKCLLVSFCLQCSAHLNTPPPPRLSYRCISAPGCPWISQDAAYSHVVKNWMAWSGEIFFLLKCLSEFLPVLFNQVVKRSPVFFLAGLHFVSEKNEDKISKHAHWMQQSGTRTLQPKKDTGECFST